MIVFSGGGGRPPDYMAIVNIRSMMAHVLLSQARNAPKSTVAYASKLALSVDKTQADRQNTTKWLLISKQKIGTIPKLLLV
jgi:hypothetical protein